MATPEPDQKRNPASTNRAPSEHAKLWRDADLNNLELLHAHFLTQSFAPHTHETYAIGFIEHGAETFDYRRQRHTAGAGTIAVIHPGEIHTGGPLGAHGWHYRALYPEPMLMTKLSAEIDCNHSNLPFFDQPVIYDVELFGELWRSHIALEGNATLLERESRLLWALARMIERYAHSTRLVRPPKPERYAVSIMVDYLHDNLPNNITLEELSQLTQLSTYHLLRVFRNAMGLPPHAYLNQLRIYRAKSLLLGGAPPADVAAQVGFADQSHLTRLFKRTVGVTPGVVAPDRSADRL
jgi:AraC-like DNA-binding protein